jgi:hypothetical protein
MMRLDGMQSDLGEMKTTLRELAASVARLAVIEEKQANTTAALERAFSAVAEVQGDSKEMDRRLRNIELALPGLVELRAWVIRGILAGVGMIGFAVFKLVTVVS